MGIKLERCSESNREVGDPGCASEKDIDYFVDGLTLTLLNIEQKIEFIGT
jgi:hypothetical protein